MNRQQFLDRLRAGLGALPKDEADDIVSDYAAHFAEGEAAGRPPEAVAQALGDPGRLARELRAEAGLKRWEENRNPSAAAGAVFAVLGLATLDILILLPLLMAIGGVLLGLAVAVIGVFFGGCAAFVVGLTGGAFGVTDNPFQAVFVGLGLMSGSVAGGAVWMLIVSVLVSLLVRYGRLHYRLLKPAVGQGSAR